MKQLHILILSLFIFSSKASLAQADLTTVNTLTIYYVDNSQTSVYGKLNAEVIESLRQRVIELQEDDQDYFLAYLSNGQQGRFSSTEKDFLDRDLPEFLDRKTRGGNYEWDKQMFREFFLTQFQYKVKQTVELNFYLSAYSIYNLKNKLGDLPSPLTLATEIPLYLNNPDVNIKVNYFISKLDEVTQDKDFNPGSISDLLDFYVRDIGKGKIRQRLNFL